MVNSDATIYFAMLIDFPTEFGSNLAASLPFVLPLLFGAILLLLYQRYLPPKETRRSVIILIGLVGLIGAFILILYSGFGFTFGSYDLFVAILQRVSHMLFTYSIVYFMVYLVGTILIFAFMARYVITPPDPDFTAMRSQLKDLTDTSESIMKQKKELEAENKRLSEFLKDKEETLEVLQSELEGLKVSVGARESSLAEMESKLRESPSDETAEQELLETISKKDETISRLQSELADLQLIMNGSGTPAAQVVSTPHDSEKIEELEAKLTALTSRIEDYARRAETATEVSDSVISDLAELISQVGASGLEPPIKKTLTSLIEGLGRSMGRIIGKPAEKDDAPKIELIGAVMMVHEVVDSIKKMTRK
ncbi:MAG: hypothetical protein ACFFDR_08090 [Candidatus Thorarchaeota archaeon]